MSCVLRWLVFANGLLYHGYYVTFLTGGVGDKAGCALAFMKGLLRERWLGHTYGSPAGA